MEKCTMEPVTFLVLAKPAAIFAYALLEYWLGKTDKVKAGSTIELLVNAVKYVLKSKAQS